MRARETRKKGGREIEEEANDSRGQDAGNVSLRTEILESTLEILKRLRTEAKLERRVNEGNERKERESKMTYPGGQEETLESLKKRYEEIFKKKSELFKEWEKLKEERWSLVLSKRGPEGEEKIKKIERRMRKLEVEMDVLNLELDVISRKIDRLLGISTSRVRRPSPRVPMPRRSRPSPSSGTTGPINRIRPLRNTFVNNPPAKEVKPKLNQTASREIWTEPKLPKSPYETCPTKKEQEGEPEGPTEQQAPPPGTIDTAPIGASKPPSEPFPESPPLRDMAELETELMSEEVDEASDLNVDLSHLDSMSMEELGHEVRDALHDPFSTPQEDLADDQMFSSVPNQEMALQHDPLASASLGVDSLPADPLTTPPAEQLSIDPLGDPNPLHDPLGHDPFDPLYNPMSTSLPIHPAGPLNEPYGYGSSFITGPYGYGPIL